MRSCDESIYIGLHRFYLATAMLVFVVSLEPHRLFTWNLQDTLYCQKRTVFI